MRYLFEVRPSMACAIRWGMPSLVRYQPSTAEVATMSMMTAVWIDESTMAFQSSFQVSSR